LGSVASFVLFNRSAAEPAVVLADELRVGVSWVGVTPPAAGGVAPALSLNQLGNTSVLAWSTNAPGFLLESKTVLADTVPWVGLNVLVYPTGGQFVVTNGTAGGNLFYRLRKP
jgi:hypothetical protein